MTKGSPWRTPGTVEIDAIDWDIILWFGGFNIVCEGLSGEGSPRLSSNITLVDGVSLSSPQMLEDVGDGTRLTTLSGNTYVLRGKRRTTWKEFTALTIFETPRQEPRWRQVFRQILRRFDSLDFRQSSHREMWGFASAKSLRSDLRSREVPPSESR